MLKYATGIPAGLSKIVLAAMAVAVVSATGPGVHAQTTVKKEVAVITTDHGEMVIEFWDDVAPETVANFKKLANDKFYDGTAFHRIIDGFMIQGGDPLTKDPSKKAQWGMGGPGYTIKAEFNDRPHVRGVISMARTDDPDSAGSQFFICVAEAKFLDGKYTGFGKLVAGDDVLEKLAKSEVASAGGERSSPVERVNVVSIRIEEREVPAAGR